MFGGALSIGYRRIKIVDLEQHLLRQMAWSHATFGPGQRMDGVIDHIRKELIEVIESDGAADEWVDVVILALDGLTRKLAFIETENYIERRDPEGVAAKACERIKLKQRRNESRTWPDWRTADPGKAIEHIKK